MPADRVEISVVTCPAAIGQATPIEVDLSFPAGRVIELEIIIPDGHAGATGLAIAQSHQIVIPARGTNWIVGNDEPIKWALNDPLHNGSWSAFAYNTDPLTPHSWYLRWLVEENPLPAPGPQVALSPAAIVRAGTALVGA